MTNILLIIILVLLILITLFSVITMLTVIEKSKNKDKIMKILKVFGTIFSIVLILVITIGISNGISNAKGSKKSQNVKETEIVSLQEAGFNEVSLNEYLDLIRKDEKSIILVARPTCSYCEKFAPILKQAKDDMNLTVNYIDTDKFSEDDWNTFNESLDYLKSEQWGTPLTLIVQNGEAIAENNGYVELSTIKDFFKDNGLGN